MLGPAKVDCPLRIFKFWNVIDLDILLVKKSKICAAFLIINEKNSFISYLQSTLNGS